MNRPANSPPADPGADPSSPVDDQALRRALRAMPPPVEAARLEALQAAVLAHWQGLEHRPAMAPQGNGGGRTQLLQLDGARRRWALVSGVMLSASLAAVLWLQRPDPVLEELMQPDVLSQMAIGEM